MGRHTLVTQPSVAPTRKITAAGLGGLLASIVLGAADLADVVEFPPFVSAILAGLSAFVTGYSAKAKASEA